MSWEGQVIRSKLGLMTEEELGDALGVQVSTLETWRAQGTGPCHTKLGKQVFYRFEDVQRWVLANVVMSDR